ncbi:MAG: RNA 2'-phosphotransferase [Candidatus Fischerbacteria bacterium RBG_13_37_8]|uniref:Probable RNA 2'-phosphotransferase n=1 Tax=Candidatus Fischerbacteria bacterium RBG_13_37_8 TaxID=1817863 RepID=A0A1F5VLA9_9BACT|nr:MAG: RNA 2'-phosphotransferase [Candidatus Fischerbacteria bacterium RBG_13_37_8]
MNGKLIKLSKFICKVLRHEPEAIGLELDSEGWVNVDELLLKAKQAGVLFDRETIEMLIQSSDKKRFILSEDRKKIRATHGHSISVALHYEAKEPPEFLYHGTAWRFVSSIKENGLQPKGRQFVHLSVDKETAADVGRRHGKPVILTIKSYEMHANGLIFYKSESGIWLTKSVPPEYIISKE